ncbi:MAG: hypothetical protein J6D52_00310 [Clostridia bacterium]|nr:hypothetical protein [Clostridia bacterium]
MKRTLAVILSILMIVVTITSGNILSVSAATLSTNEELNDVNNWVAITGSNAIYPSTGDVWLRPMADTELKGGNSVSTIKFTGVNAYTYATKLSVEKNKNYTLSFDYYSENLYNWDANRQVVYNTVGVAPLKEGSLIYRSSTTATPAALSTVCAGGYLKALIHRVWLMIIRRLTQLLQKPIITGIALLLNSIQQKTKKWNFSY